MFSILLTTPIARIHIRRFDNKKGESVAVPEESIYGQDMPEFLETVKKWLDSKQGPLAPGAYCRRGGGYSDTFGDERKKVFGPDPTNVKTIRGWLKKWLGSDKEHQRKYYQYFLKALQAFFNQTKNFLLLLYKKLKRLFSIHHPLCIQAHGVKALINFKRLLL